MSNTIPERTFPKPEATEEGNEPIKPLQPSNLKEDSFEGTVKPPLLNVLSTPQPPKPHDAAIIIQRNFKKYALKEAASKPLVSMKDRKVIEQTMKEVNRMISDSESANMVNQTPYSVLSEIIIRNRQEKNPLEQLKKVIDSRVANCWECAHLLAVFLKQNTMLSEKIKNQVKVYYLKPPDDHVLVVIGNIQDPNAVIVDPWLMYLNLAPKAGYRPNKVLAKGRNRGFLGTKEQYLQFLKSHEDGIYVKTGGHHQLEEQGLLLKPSYHEQFLAYATLPLTNLADSSRFRGPVDENGKPHGEGTKIYPNGKRITGKWDHGDIKYGIVDQPSMGTYEGSLLHEFAHGKGMFTDKNGFVSKGDFENDLFIPPSRTSWSELSTPLLYYAKTYLDRSTTQKEIPLILITDENGNSEQLLLVRLINPKTNLPSYLLSYKKKAKLDQDFRESGKIYLREGGNKTLCLDRPEQLNYKRLPPELVRFIRHNIPVSNNPDLNSPQVGLHHMTIELLLEKAENLQLGKPEIICSDGFGGTIALLKKAEGIYLSYMQAGRAPGGLVPLTKTENGLVLSQEAYNKRPWEPIRRLEGYDTLIQNLSRR